MEPGKTPLVEVNGIYAKLECANPCGSIKDRIAKYIIDESERKGLLKPGQKIVEASSGNTGISLTYFAAQKGYEITIVMPENMTEERKKIIRDFGGNLILCSAGDFAQAASIRDKMAEDPQYFNTDQFSNPLNVECHEKTTAQEILTQIKPFANKVDAFVAGVGTGGTLIGVAKALRKVNPKVHIVAVEPTESAVMSGGEPGLHTIPGIGDGFIPAIASDGKGGLHEYIDEVICISSEDAKSAALEILDKSNLCVGISSGANYLAALELKKRFNTVVTVFPDGFSKYQSHGLKCCEEGTCEFEDKNRAIFAYYKSNFETNQP
ncbi:cysteine synthase family protein [bacterium]|nr:cysteine synthase family protein [bacterium]MBU1025805.1 cysteine synthase family protein [bacterium]